MPNRGAPVLGNLLIVCRSQAELALLARCPRQSGERHLVASDDLRVHEEARKLPWVAEVCWLEEMESWFAVAPDVLRILQAINAWLASWGKGANRIPRELFFWVHHCEGGMTTQRIQDLLLLIRSYLALLSLHQVSRLVILRHPGAWWEDQVLADVARSRAVRVQFLGGCRWPVLRAHILSRLKNLVREPYHLSQVIRAKLRRLLVFRGNGAGGRKILFQICNSHQKSIEDILPLMKALQAQGREPVSLHWRASAAVKKIRRAGFEAEELDAWVPLSSLGMVFRFLRLWRQVRQKRGQFFRLPEQRYRQVELGPGLWPSVRFFFLAELARRYRLWQAARRYFSRVSLQALRLWGGGVLPEGYLTWKCLGRQPKPLIFYWDWIYLDNPYEYAPEFIDLFLAAGPAHREHLEKYGVSPERIAPVGLMRYENLPDFKNQFTPDQSRSHLKIPSGFSHYIFLDPNVAIRGLISAKEQALLTNALLEFASRHPEAALLIKPHPACRPGPIESLVAHYPPGNVFLLDRKMLPYHVLNAADLLVTKHSTLGLEAMLLGKPVIAVILDGEPRFRAYGEAAEYVYSLEFLQRKLSALVRDPVLKDQWTKDQLGKHHGFLKGYVLGPHASPAAHGAETIAEFIEHHHPGNLF